MDYSTYLRFSDARVESEWLESLLETEPELQKIHPAIYVIVTAAALWHFRRTGQPATVTHILRTNSEQRLIYPDDPSRRSPHEFGRAVDLRTRHLKAGESDQWHDWINRTFEYYGQKGLSTAVCHEIGGRGRHMHIQVGPAEKPVEN